MHEVTPVKRLATVVGTQSMLNITVAIYIIECNINNTIKYYNINTLQNKCILGPRELLFMLP